MVTSKTMNLKKLVSGLLLSTVLAAGIGVSVASHKSSVKKAEAAYTALYITGSACGHGWNDTAVAAYKLNQDADGNGYGVFTLTANNAFRFTKGDGSWTQSYGWSQMNSAASDYSLIGSTFTAWGSDNNIRCNTAGTYTFVYNFSSNKVQVYSGTVTRTSISGFVLTGEGSAFSTSWAPSGSILLNDSVTDPSQNLYEKRDIAMSAGSQMRVAYSDHYGFTQSGWKSWGSTPSGFSKSGDNLVLTNAGLVTIFVNKSYVGYASYKSGYSITYHRNNGTSLSYTADTKTPGSSYTIRTPGTAPLNASGWNPTTYKRFLRWNTTSEGTGVNYSAGATYTTDASLELYYIEEWYQYRYRVDSGSWITLSENNEGKGEGIKVQFAPSSAQSLPLHGKLYFQYSSNGGSNWNDLTSITFEGNYNTTTGIELSTLDTIYLKITDSNTYKCWVPGISDRTVCVFDSSSATTGGTPYTMKGDGDNQTVTVEEVTINKGQFVKRGYGGNYTYGSYFAGGTGTAASCFSQVGSDTAVQCTKTGVYTVYNQKGEYSNWNDLWFTRNEEASAKYLAQQFNSIIGDICTAVISGSKGLSDLQNAWGSKSGTALYNHFNGQIAATLAYFSTSTTTSDADILACIAKYDYIERKYGTTALPDFLSRNNGYTANGQGSILITLFGENGNNTKTLLSVVIISTISALSVGGYFLLRKKKEK